MHIHRLEKIWLLIGFSMLVIFLGVIGVGAFALGMQPPTGHHQAIDPDKVDETPPFDRPGLEKIGEKEYNAYMVAYAFGYKQDKLEVPVGSTIHFQVTSSDVVHGFQIPGTNVNLMVVPGEVNHLSYTFKEPGEYLVLCNEYCGAGHEYMATTIIVS
ncbi:subunit 2 of cytochrome c oxidase [Paenibacillus sp. 32O-W]|jgi:cytochrome c oxidase subunit 2|uniref:Cytochrome aa3 subunit 2 n=1 Tax=Paenibacillus cisolokensis TaxID=1658519 RepID=A0ABQ4N366_9BACL|nr:MULTISPECIES: cytochrome c oxidase subunit II [Paenibacillus]ALS28120.1 subunit 2 of cytochrome c oxidase [Paenibacillus sp. 32O-W]GIQ62590.1 cytochrome c oxidase subunit 2 [Paenibacillus cisolokensis]